MEPWSGELTAEISVARNVKFSIPLDVFRLATGHFDESIREYLSGPRNSPFAVQIPPNLVTYFMEWLTWWLSDSAVLPDEIAVHIRPLLDEIGFCTDKRGRDFNWSFFDSDPISSDISDSPPAEEVPCSYHQLLLNESVEGKLYHRREKYKNGYYYKCVDKTCGARIFMTAETVQVIRRHSPECENTLVNTTDQEDQWIAIEEYVQDRARRGWSTAALICDIADHHPEMRAIFSLGYQGIVSLVNKYSPEDSQSLHTALESLIDIENIIRYQETYPDKMVVIASDESIRLANTATWILVDGTFKTSPPGFTQMVTLLGRDQSDKNSLFFPVCHILLTNKREETYQRMFKILDSIVSLPMLRVVTTDFEKGLINAIRSWQERTYPEATLRGCRFHFSQCLMRKYMKLHGRQLNILQWAFIRIMMWTCFLERKTINAMLDVLESFSCNEAQFIAYYKKTWLNSDNKLWNLSDIDPDDIVTTNNAIESFHSVLDDGLPKGPTIERLVWFLDNYTTRVAERIRLQNEDARVMQKRILRPTEDEILFRFRELLTSYQPEPTGCSRESYELIGLQEEEIAQVEQLREAKKLERAEPYFLLLPRAPIQMQRNMPVSLPQLGPWTPQHLHAFPWPVLPESQPPR